MRRHTAKPARLSAGKEPPSEFRLFPLGTVRTEKGTFFLTPDDAKACLEAQAQYANALSIDYGHGAFEEAAGAPQRAAGWIEGLELRKDGLYAVGVTWTETASAMLRRREQRYFSPAFETDDDGHIRKIINVALTLIPATHGLTPLVASRRSGRRTRKTSMKYCKASDLLALADEFDKEDDEKSKAMAAKLRKLAEDGEDDDADGESKEEKTSDAPEDEDKKEASQIASLAREITGKRSASEVEGSLRALSANAASLPGLSKRVAELEADALRGRVESYVKLHATPGPKCKVTPAEVPSLIKWGIKDFDALKTYLDERGVLVAASTSHTPPAEAPVALSDEEEKVIRLCGLNREAFIASRQKRALGEHHDCS